MRNVPLHESHLLEAVRQKILSSDQMEQVLALARARPAGGAIADVRWATVVQGLLASAAVGGSALGILVDTTDHGANLGTVAYSVVGLLAMLGASIALRKLVEFTYDHHRDNEDFIRLVMNENIQRGDYLRQSSSIQQLNQNAIRSVRDVYDRGVGQGVFRPGLDPVDIHSAISAFTFFNVSNRHTFGVIFQDRASKDKADTLKREHVVELILRFVRHSISA